MFVLSIFFYVGIKADYVVCTSDSLNLVQIQMVSKCFPETKCLNIVCYNVKLESLLLGHRPRAYNKVPLPGFKQLSE